MASPAPEPGSTSTLATLRRGMAVLSPRLRWTWIGMIPLALLSAACEAVGAAAVYGLITLISTPARLGELPVLSTLYRAYPWTDQRTFLAFFGILAAGFYLLKNGVLLIEAYVRQQCAARTAVNLSTRLVRAYLLAPYAFHLRRSSADLIRRADSTVDVFCRLVLISAVTAVSESLIVVAVMAVLVASAPLVTLLTGGVVLAVLALLLRATQHRLRLWGLRVQETSRTILVTLQHSLGGIKEVKVLGREAFFVDRFARLRTEFSRYLALRATLEGAPRLLVETLFVAGMVAVLVGAASLDRGERDLAPLLALFAYAGFRLLPSAHRIVYHLNNVRFGGTVTDEILGDLEAVAAEPGDRPSPAGESLRLPFKNRIVLEGVSYTYADRPGPTLDRVSLEIARGESIGIVGSTGTGKSTLVDLVLGLLEPSAGRITVDGTDIAGHLRAWRRQVGYVPQTVFLTDDTLRRNVALGLRDAEIDEGQIQAAIRLAQLEPFVTSLPGGLDTVVGERGVRLSGGQRQRVAIARALYPEPDVLVLDEATSSLDALTEAELTRAIESLGGEKTLLVVAHRLTTVRRCDRLVLLQDGRVADTGPYADLLARSPAFRALAGE